MYSKTHAVLAVLLVGSVACGGKTPTGGDPSATPTPVATPTPTPTSTPAASHSGPCRLAAPTVDCSVFDPPEIAPVLQEGIDRAVATPGVMDVNQPDRLWDVNLFRSKVVDYLTSQKFCGAVDHGNETADEIYTRTPEGCHVEQYDLISGTGGVRNASSRTRLWEADWGEPVPPLKPEYPKEDPTCSLASDRSAFCVQIKGTSGELGFDVFQLVVQVINEHPELIDRANFIPGQGDLVPEEMKMAAWGIRNVDAYIAAVEKKLRAHGYCAIVEKGDILKVKKVSSGNLFHEEYDFVQNPEDGGSYTSFVVKDRCHPAGF